MKIAVIGASGMVGTQVVAEAARRRHDVIAVSRNGIDGVRADASDRGAMSQLLSEVDSAVMATRPRPGDEASVGPTTEALLDAALKAGTRLLVVGGAAPLRSPNGGLVLDDTSFVPADIRPIAAASLTQFEVCQAHAADWVYLSPPALLEPGDRTGGYRRGRDVLLTEPSRISAADLAVAVLDELERPAPDRHFTVGW